jgi:hypothetical protein
MILQLLKSIAKFATALVAVPAIAVLTMQLTMWLSEKLFKAMISYGQTCPTLPDPPAFFMNWLKSPTAPEVAGMVLATCWLVCRGLDWLIPTEGVINEQSSSR